MDFIAVGLGGMVGSLCRYSFNLLFKMLGLTEFPWATLTVNSVGCLIAGMGVGIVSERGLSPNLGLLLITGFCGGFTTFSAMGVETLTLFRDGASTAALMNVSANILIGLPLAALGFWAIR